MPAAVAAVTGRERERYAVPALERGLDILEMLALGEHGQTLSAIAAALGFRPAAIFRMMACLERRGYVLREGPRDLYRLSLRLFELSHASTPMKRLLDVALPEMRALSAEIGQSCHLGAETEGELLILADVESPRPINLAFRIGARWPLLTTVSGRVILAHLPGDMREGAIARAGGVEQAETFASTLSSVSERGYDLNSDETFLGITDIGAPVLGRHGAVASLTLAYVRPSRQPVDFAPVVARLLEAAARVSRGIGGASFERMAS